MRFIIFLLLFILNLPPIFSQEKFTISGYVRELGSGEELIGATIYIEELNTGTSSNVYGFYSITLSEGNYNLIFSYIGYSPVRKNIVLDEDKKIDTNLPPDNFELNEIVVSAEKKNKNIEKVEMSINRLPIKTIKNIPTLMGEVDIIKSIQLLPGIQTKGEGTSGFYVRGGSIDQNLILLDEANVYNVAHVGGLFSVFNGDAIKNVEIYKGGIPAEYGGRLSSLLDVRMKEGNSERFSASGGIGILSSRLTIEGPLAKDKCSFIISGRRTYADLFLPLSKDTIVQKSQLYFYDLNTKINYRLNDNNRLFLSGYFGRDVLKIGGEMEMSYGNRTGTLRWNHLFSNRLFSNITLIYSDFNYNMGVPEGAMAFSWISKIIDHGIKNDYTFYLNPGNTIKFGIQSLHHHFKPGVIKQIGESIFSGITLPDSYALEHALFASNEQKISGLISIQYGLRYSIFQNTGKSTLYSFDKSNPEEYLVNDTIYKSKGIFNTYSGIEPRFGIRYTLNEYSSLKASYNRTFQYIHLATNSTTATPIDIWFPSSPNVKPQKADQIALGYFRNFRNNSIETSAEVYYKYVYNAIDFKDHAELFANPLLEKELRIGNAYSYGLELLVKKPEGKLNGWISYTLSKTLRKIPEINKGKVYSAPHDKTHDISIVLAYKISNRLDFSGNWVYSSGNPVTAPTGRFEYRGMLVPVYSDRNSVRLPAFHRLDLSLTIKNKGRNKRRQKRNNNQGTKFESSWNFSVYNAYNRHNAFSVNFSQSEDDPNKTVKKTLLI